MVKVEFTDNACFLVDILDDHRIELVELAAIFHDSYADTLKEVIAFGLKSLTYNPHQ